MRFKISGLLLLAAAAYLAISAIIGVQQQRNDAITVQVQPLVAIFLIFDADAIIGLTDPRTLAVVCATGFIYVFGSLTWYGAINRLSLAWTTALTIPGVPMLSFLFAIVFLGEHPSGREVCGMLIAVAGVFFLVLGADANRKHRDAELAEAVHPPLA